LDGVRGLAIAVVLAGHAFESHIPGAPYVGVDIFFVLSGYLITTLLLAESGRTGRIDLRRFYLRRALRLLPALLVLLAVYGVFALLGSSGDRTTRLGAVAAAGLYVSNWAQAFTIVHPTDLQHTWSLALEEQFYLVWPIVIGALVGSQLRLERCARVLVAGLVAAFAGRYYVAHVNNVFGAGLYFSPIVWIDALIIGCLLAVLHASGRVGRRPLPVLAMVPVAAVLGAVCASGAGDRLVDGGITAVGLAAAAVVLTAAVGTGPIAGVLRHRVLVRLGVLSYALYLWHFVILGWLGRRFPDANRDVVGIATIVASLGVASVSYRFVERPFLRLKERLGRPAAPSASR